MSTRCSSIGPISSGGRFDSLSEPIGGEFIVNTYVEGDQRNAVIAIRADGNFAAVWQSDDQDSSGFGIFADNRSSPR